MKVDTSDKKVVDVWAIFAGTKESVATYGVECDGGGVTLRTVDKKTLVANSDYLRGEVAGAEEGCSNANLTLKNVIFKKTKCD